MFALSRFFTGCGLAIATALLLVLPGSAAAQHPSAGYDAGADSVSWLAPREPLECAKAILRTRDRQVALLLTDTTLVLQLTDAGLEHVAGSIGATPTGGPGAGVLARILGAGVAVLLDHGIAYRLTALRGARVEGGHLVLEDYAGNRVFENTEVNGRRVMHDFPPAEAERFAAAVERAIGRVARTAKRGER
jgi:hypothetical protein